MKLFRFYLASMVFLLYSVGATAQSDTLLLSQYQQHVQEYFDYYERGQADSAEMALRGALLTLSDYEGNFLLEANLAELVVSRGDTVGALSLLTSVLNSHDALDEVRSRRAELLEKTGRRQDALADLGILIDKYPKSEIYRYRRVLVLRDLGLYEGAAADLRVILENNPDAYIPRVTLAEVLAEQGEYVQAEQILSGLIDEYPEQHMAARSLVCYYLRRGQKAPALETIRKAINSGKRVTAEEYLVRAMVWLAYGESFEANRDFAKAKELGASEDAVNRAKTWLTEMKTL